MLAVRAVLAILLVVMGAFITIRMLQYPLAQSFTGVVLGGAMIVLGVVRFRQVREVMRKS